MSSSSSSIAGNEKQRAEKYFDSYVSSSSGTISKSDALAAFCQFYPHEEPTHILELLDKNNNNSISKNDFLKIACNPDLVKPPPPTLREFCDIVQQGNIQQVKKAVEQDGFSIKTQLSAEALSSLDDYTPTPVKICATKNYVDILMYLLTRGADVTGGASSEDSMTFIADRFYGRNSSSSLLSRSNKTTRTISRKIRPLFVAVSQGRVDITRILLNFGANPCASGSNGLTPLHQAAMSCDDPQQSKKENEEKLEILKLLIEKVPPTVKFGLLKNDGGLTVLHCAVLSGSEEAVKLVLNNLRSVTARTERDADGKTALQYAQEQEMGRIVELVKHYGL